MKTLNVWTDQSLMDETYRCCQMLGNVIGAEDRSDGRHVVRLRVNDDAWDHVDENGNPMLDAVISISHANVKDKGPKVTLQLAPLAAPKKQGRTAA